MTIIVNLRQSFIYSLEVSFSAQYLVSLGATNHFCLLFLPFLEQLSIKLNQTLFWVKWLQLLHDKCHIW